MSNRVLGNSVYFKVLAEVEREIAEYGDYAYNRVGRVVQIDGRTVKAMIEVGLRAVPTRNRPGLPPIKDVIQGRVPRPEGAPVLTLPNGEVPMPFSPINRSSERIPLSAPAPVATPEPLPPPPQIPVPEFPDAEDFPEVPEFPEFPEAPPAQEEPVAEPAPPPPSPAPAERQNLVTEIMRQSERYIEKREFQEIAVKHVRDGARALSAALTAAEGVQVSCTTMLSALQPALARQEYDLMVRLNSGERIPARELVELTNALAKASQAAAAGMKAVLEAKQLLLGGPTEIIGLSRQGAPVEGAGPKNDPQADAWVASLLSGKLLGGKENVIDVSVEESPEEGATDPE